MVKFSNEAIASVILILQSLLLSSNTCSAFVSPTTTLTNKYSYYSNDRRWTTVSVQRGDIHQSNNEQFTNDGFFSWMQPFLTNFGYVEGKSVYLGGPGSIVDQSNFPSDEEQGRLRMEAKENMTNIGLEERERRRNAGQIAYKVVIGYAILSSLILDDGSIVGHFARFAIALPLFLATGYTKSAETGL